MYKTTECSIPIYNRASIFRTKTRENLIEHGNRRLCPLVPLNVYGNNDSTKAAESVFFTLNLFHSIFGQPVIQG